ncbi:DUF3299 domain-containing protein, partial [Leptospira sp. 96542]|nr:DUF3299 domain-containing protein [Leptospira sp. 96542]
MKRIPGSGASGLRMWRVLSLLLVMIPLAGRAYQGDPPPVVPPFKGDYQVTRWGELVPKDWDPYALFDGLKKDGGPALAFNDASPQAMELLDKLREVWDNAPTDHALDGARTRLPGYVVPLEEGPQGLKEFLLVPYFGACI